MGENKEIHESAASRCAAVCAGGRVRNMVEVWDARAWRSESVVLEGTVYEVGSGHLAVSDPGDLVAIGEYHRGVELWDWRGRRLVWRTSRVGRVQSVAFASDGRELVVSTDGGAVILAAGDGSVIGKTLPLRDATPSPFAPLLFGVRRKTLSVLRRDTGGVLSCGGAHSFGILAAAFTPHAVIVSETDGFLRAFGLLDGGCISETPGWFVRVAPCCTRECVVGWSSAAERASGELIEVDLASGGAKSIVRKAWGDALPILSGTAWVFSDGAMVEVGGP